MKIQREEGVMTEIVVDYPPEMNTWDVMRIHKREFEGLGYEVSVDLDGDTLTGTKEEVHSLTGEKRATWVEFRYGDE